MARLTATHLRKPWRGADRWLSDSAARGDGRLVARLRRDGVALYYRYRVNGQNRAIPLGAYDEAGKRGLSLKKARDRAAELAALIRSGVTDLHRHLEREQRATERAAHEAEEAARREQQAAERGTLAALCRAYIDYLRRQGKQAAKDAESIFALHVTGADPRLAGRKAADITAAEFSGLIGHVIEAGKGRTAAKLRAYLRAAYSLAVRSHTDPEAPLAMRTFGVTANPLADIAALARFNRARDRVLNAPELAAYLQRLEALPDGVIRDALLSALYLGGQRPAQLLRMRAADADLHGGTVTLHDPKGARHEPRRHVLPLNAEAAAIVARRIEGLAGAERAFQTRPETISAAVADLSRDMLAAGEAREPFQLRDVRRTCETMLAALGVSSDVRAQLQSHGLGGVQNRHYDRHDYMPEKQRALELWARHVQRLKNGEAATVTPFRRQSASA